MIRIWDILGRLLMFLVFCLVVLVVLAGCTPLTEKAERYGEVGERFLNPDEVKIEYRREGNTVSGYEMRCFGKTCDELEKDE